MAKDSLKAMYRTVNKDEFPPKMSIEFTQDDGTTKRFDYRRVTWTIDGQAQGLRYGENPDQPAALYSITSSPSELAGLQLVDASSGFSAGVELLQSGKHPSKTNLTDVDAALSIIQYFENETAAVIVKHNNPSGVAIGATVHEAYTKAFLADAVAAFGGAMVVNQKITGQDAATMVEKYFEVIAAPEFSTEALEVFATKKNLRVIKLVHMDELYGSLDRSFLEFKSLIDGSLVVQKSFTSGIRRGSDLREARTEYKGVEYVSSAPITDQIIADMVFGWKVESAVTSNSVIFVKNGVTIGIGTGEQDRVGVAEIARDKAYKRYGEKLALEQFGGYYSSLNSEQKAEIDRQVAQDRGGLAGSVMVSDGFFPFRDGVDVGLAQNIAGVVQPGGSLRDYEVIEACNQGSVPMRFTGQRSFKH